MRLKKITISGFRCFGPSSVNCHLAGKLTAVVGPNSSGKTALLHALSKLFGVSRSQRTLHRSDFHLPSGVDPEDRSSRELFIDVLIEFPELVEGDATPETIAPSFRHMLIEGPEKAPVCRMRLEAQWDDDGTVEGEVVQELYWVDTLASEPSKDKKHKVSAADRGLIQLIYTPASRDPRTQIRDTTGALAARLLRAIKWSEDTQETIENTSETLSNAFEDEEAIKAIGSALRKRWSALHDEVVDTHPKLSLMSRRFEEVVGRINVIFQQGPNGFERGLEALSDGQQSLLYFALAAAVFDLERLVVAGKVEGFRADELRIPALTVLALEEPENHLSPYYLARIIRQIRSLVKGGRAQAVVTSHSPAVLGRVFPDEVRYCRRNQDTGVSSIKSIKMPARNEEASKFMHGAMLAFPELYFARFVLLVEGDSERIVLPRLAKAMDLLIDPAFVAIVPLGGRHVQHFWRLLSQLKIPYATLLDLDLGRRGGGFGRVKTAIQRLLDVDVPKEKLLDRDDGTLLSDDNLQEMHKWQEPKDVENLMNWVERLQPYDVFFSSPLDFDLMMLEAFPDAYMALVPPNRRSKKKGDEAAVAVLGTNRPGLALYGREFSSFRDHFPAYRYHFLTHSKPATHMAAMAQMDSQMILQQLPETIKVVLNHVAENVR